MIVSRETSTVKLRGELPKNLTPRMIEIAECVALGMTDRAIGTFLHTSTQTVKNLLHDAYRRVGVRNRVGLAIWIIKNCDCMPPVEITIVSHVPR